MSDDEGNVAEPLPVVSAAIRRELARLDAALLDQQNRGGHRELLDAKIQRRRQLRAELGEPDDALSVRQPDGPTLPIVDQTLPTIRSNGSDPVALNPPAIGLYLLSLFLRPAELEVQLGDIQEAYAVQIKLFGVQAALLWFYCQIGSCIGFKALALGLRLFGLEQALSKVM